MLTKLLATALMLSFAGTAFAEPLPKDAKPLSAAQVTKLYSGNSTNWKTSGAYFAADGTIKGRYSSGIYWGRWVVKKNEICMEDVQGYDTKSKEAWDGIGDCWKWWADGKGKTITLWSRRFNGEKPDLANDHYRGEADKIQKGDKVSKVFDKAYAKIAN